MFNIIKEIKYISIGLLVIGLSFQACEDPYTPELEVEDSDPLLIVDGFIDVTGNSKFKIAKSTPIVTSTGFVGPIGPFNSAKVTIISENGQSYPGNWNSAQGLYQVDHPALNPQEAYFVRIQVGAKVYESDASRAIPSGEIADLEMKLEDDGIEILVSSADPNHGSPYYRWEYEEAWKFNSAIKPTAIMQNGQLVDITPETDYGTCFRFNNSSNILIASTQEFSENRIYKRPIQSISSDSEKLGLRYSILVRQYAISAASFAFWELIRKNSEQIGDIFGSMPSEVSGNIRNVDDPEEKVVGFIEVLQPTEKRIYINNFELPHQWMALKNIPFYNGCSIPDTLTVGDAPDFFNQFPGYLPGWFIYANPTSPFPTHVNFSLSRCVDCRFYGQMEKPDFWIE